uniref:DUF1471 domain-containing protein n=2 Tax=Serratia grimesii TaxID=82995 RepID=UPI001F4C22AC|nr:DUF1471 domain-containing protein [Serratia grimesii]
MSENVFDSNKVINQDLNPFYFAFLQTELHREVLMNRISLSLFSVAFFLLAPALHAATLVSKSELKGYERTGRISVSSVPGSKTSAIKALRDEADKRNAEYIHITSVGSGGNSSHWFGTAITLKKKTD